jgi:hypothetical protein
MKRFSMRFSAWVCFSTFSPLSLPDGSQLPQRGSQEGAAENHHDLPLRDGVAQAVRSRAVEKTIPFAIGSYFLLSGNSAVKQIVFSPFRLAVREP